MKRFAVFAILGPPIAAATFYLLLLPLAGVLEGVPIVIDTPVLPVWSYAVFAALVVAVFDWVASIIELPLRPIGAAVAGWLMAFLLLREILALPDLPGWFAAVGMLGAIPGFVCSWVTMRMDGTPKIRSADLGDVDLQSRLDGSCHHPPDLIWIST